MSECDKAKVAEVDAKIEELSQAVELEKIATQAVIVDLGHKIRMQGRLQEIVRRREAQA